MKEILQLNIGTILKLYKSKELSPTDLITEYIDHIQTYDSTINAFITKTFDQAIENAKKTEERITKSEMLALDGIPIAIKDIFCTKDIKTTCASKMLHNFIPKYESTVTQNLQNEGAISLGKVNMDEFAMGSLNTTSYFGKVTSPIKSANDNLLRSPGGSSGGSSAAVRSYMCIAALGSDTGGSVRQPAAWTGTVGYKPTYGRFSRYGIIAFASSLDQAGIISRSVTDNAIISQYASSYDSKDSTSINKAPIDYKSALESSIKGKKIAVIKEYQSLDLSEDIKLAQAHAIEILKHNGAEVIEVNAPHINYGPEIYYIISPAEVASNLAKYDGVRYGYSASEDILDINDMYKKTRSTGFGDEVQRRILIGNFVLSSHNYQNYYIRAQKIRRMIKLEFDQIFTQADAILTPTTMNVAQPFDINQSIVEKYMNDKFTVASNLAGIPALSVPVKLDNNSLPQSIQLMTNNNHDALLFSLASCLEKNSSFTEKDLLFHDFFSSK